ncbi:MAG: trypsin-like peptidase domain-containing protein [Gloeobacteraceae cyanobacterium ES-bin-144]|nr:trypsin-like peptidase domain-containing protein [Verrucomicrobiales bacterium]
MKLKLIRAVFSFYLLLGVCMGDETRDERIRKLQEQMAALEREKAVLLEQQANNKPKLTEPAASRALLDESGNINLRISNSVVIIEGDLGVGTGFIAATGGKKYLYTAAHVFSGNSKLTIKNTQGTNFKKFGVLECAEGADLVRMEILEEVKDWLEIIPADAELPIQTEIAALGNGGGNGVVSVEKGRILGTSADSLEVDAGIIQGNSGGPVVESSNGNAVGVVTHLSAERKDVWAEGTRQAEVRRFACRLNKQWEWRPTSIGVFLVEGKALAEYDELTRLCYAMVQLEPDRNGMRLEKDMGGGATIIEILTRNKDREVVRSLFKMNADLAESKATLSQAELKKKFRSLVSQIHSQATRSNEAFKPQSYAWFHRSRSTVSVQARKESIEELASYLDRLR